MSSRTPWFRLGRLRFTLPTLLTLCLAQTAWAGVPSPPNSTCPATATVSPSGTSCFDVVVRDFANSPVAGATVAVDFGGCSIAFCPTQPHTGNIVQGTTDLAGNAHFCICATISGACQVNLYADGILLCTVSAATACGDSVPRTMSYQGVLTDGAGGVVPDGAYNFSFSIYDDPTMSGSHLLWTETHDNVPVERGGFSVLLGMGSPAVPLAIPFDKPYYLGFGVAQAPGTPGDELMPRVPLASSPYSLMARTVANCGVTASSIAPGQVVKSLNGLTDDVTLVAGSNITITPSGQSLTIASTGGGGLGGSGTANRIAKFTGATTLASSAITEIAGNVGIGTTTPAFPLDVAGTLNLAGTVRVSGGVEMRNSTAMAFYQPAVWDVRVFEEGTNPDHFFTIADFTNGSRTDLLRIHSGNAGSIASPLIGMGRTALTSTLEVEGNASKTTAGSWLANSDARIKTDVRTITGALDKLDRVRLVDFRYTDAYRAAHPSVGGRTYCNVIAQEFRDVFPNDVKASGETLANGDEILQVDTHPLTIYSVAAIQELHRMLQAKDAEIARLRSEIAAHDASLSRTEARLAALEKALRGTHDQAAAAARFER